MQHFQLALLTVCACIVAVSSAPASDPEYKPVLVPATAPEDLDDPYKSLNSPWKEPKADKYVPSTPQTGSLISTEVAVAQSSADVADIVPKNQTAVPLFPVPAKIKDLNVPIVADPMANPTQYHYPIQKDRTQDAYKESREGIAPPPVVDVTQKDVFGAQPPNVVIDRPEDPHPMEVLTPIPDSSPCDPERILNVTVPAAQYVSGVGVPYLPLRYGCSSATDVSREKISPEVTWDNVSSDVVEFSLQMIDMGDNCQANGTDFGRIHWHVTGIKAAPSVTFKEGASHDRRMLHGGTEQPNQWLEEYYAGPCPVPSVTGCYRIKVMAHRANGRCQCGHQDFLFARPMKAADIIGSLILEKTKKD